MANTIDLHIHTTASDGSDTPAVLLENLKKAGISTFSVTDHDAVDTALEMESLVTEGFRFIRGIEFSCKTPAGNCHILGYGYDPADPVFRSALEEGNALRQEKLEARLRYFRDVLGIVLTDDALSWLRSLKSPGKPHFAKILMDQGIAKSKDEAIQRYVNACPVLRDRIEGKTAISAILHAGGIPVWAHPLGGEGEQRLTVEQFRGQLTYLIGCGIRGLECHYSRYESADRAFLTGQATLHDLLISGGSDYHGSNKPGLPLGRLSADDALVAPAELTLLSVL